MHLQSEYLVVLKSTLTFYSIKVLNYKNQLALDIKESNDFGLSYFQ